MDTDTDLSKVKDLIAKLFALASNNPSQAEAESALAKAQQLLLKYNLERWQVESAKGHATTGEITDFVWAFSEPFDAKRHLCGVIARNNMGDTVGTKDDREGGNGTVHIFASETNSRIILKMVLWIMEQLERECETDYRTAPRSTGGRRQTRNSYMSDYFMGASASLDVRFKAQHAQFVAEQPAGTAMVLFNTKALSAAKIAAFPRLSTTTVRIKSSDGYGAGVRAGNGVTMARASAITSGQRRLA